MSDTPRTDAAEYESQDEPVAKLGAVDVDFARTLKRELNAANVEIEEKRKDIVYLATEKAKLEERIKRLEEELMDAKDKHAVLVADVALYEDKGERIKRLEEALEGTVKWIVHLADSGDAGFWNPEEQSVIIAARAALQAKESK